MFATVACGYVLSKPGRADLNSANLTPASGRQDHTILPSATTSLVRVLVIAHRPVGPALPSRRTQNAAASTASHPASVTIAIRPSVGRDARSSRSDLGCLKTEIFLQRGLDTKLPDGQITTRPREPLSCPGRGAACSRRCAASSGYAAPQSRDLYRRQRGGPRISSASRRKRGALRSIRGTMERWQRFIRPS